MSQNTKTKTGVQTLSNTPTSRIKLIQNMAKSLPAHSPPNLKPTGYSSPRRSPETVDLNEDFFFTPPSYQNQGSPNSDYDVDTHQFQARSRNYRTDADGFLRPKTIKIIPPYKPNGEIDIAQLQNDVKIVSFFFI